MSEQFLLDTDICSFIIKGTRPDLDTRLRELSLEQTLISAVTRAELRFGLAKRPDATRLAGLVERFLGTVDRSGCVPRTLFSRFQLPNCQFSLRVLFLVPKRQSWQRMVLACVFFFSFPNGNHGNEWCVGRTLRLL